MAEKFEKYGANERTILIFHNLDTEIKDCILAAAKSVAKSKFGYQRSPSLTGPGLELHFWKAVRSSKAMNNPLGQKQLDQAEACGIDLYEVELMTKSEVKKKIRSTRHDLWDSQKEAAAKRIEWLEQNAQHIARAAGEVDWRKKMEEMKRRAQLHAVNRKLTNAIKGTRGSLDRVEIPKYEWFYSDTTKVSLPVPRGSIRSPCPIHFPTSSPPHQSHPFL